MVKRELPHLSEAQYSRVSGIYDCFAVTLAATQGLILVRNKFVDANIFDLINGVQDDQLLVDAWELWCGKRDLHGAAWPVTIFKGEIQGAMTLVCNARAANGGQSTGSHHCTGKGSAV